MPLKFENRFQMNKSTSTFLARIPFGAIAKENGTFYP